MTNEEGNRIFDAVVPHGQKPHTTILMSTTRNTAMMYRIRHNLLQVAQETFPDLTIDQAILLFHGVNFNLYRRLLLMHKSQMCM